MGFDHHESCAEVRIVDARAANVEVYPPRKKLAIVGFATNSLHLTPWHDPEFEIWGMNQGYINFQRQADRWFEMHLPEAQPDLRDPEYATFLKTALMPIYMIDVMREYPQSVRYPIEEAMQWLGRDYFMSSAAFMGVLGALEGFTEIHFYGINLAIGEEWTYERPNCEYIIGRLEGAGIKVVVPPQASLLKQYRRYGYFVDSRPNQNLRMLLQARANDYKSKAEQGQIQFYRMLGAMEEANSLLHVAEGLDHGADIVLMPPPGA